MHFIKEIFQGNQGQEHIHRKFVRYGRGEFKGPAIDIKNSGRILKVSASDEYVNVLGEILTGKSTQNFNFSGDIISRDNIETLISGFGVTIMKSAKKKGVYTFKVAGSLPAKNLSKIYSGLESAYIFMDLDSPGSNLNLKTKKKLPKPGSGADIKFCSATLDSALTNAVMEGICFDADAKDFKEIKISHRYIVKEILIPGEYQEDLA